MLRRLLLLTIAFAGCLLSGCQASAASPTPTPAPTYRCTPEAGGAEFDCSEKQHQDMVAKDELYAEAESVYRRYVAEDLRIAKQGGVKKATPELLATTTGEFHRQAMAEYRHDLREGLVVRDGERRIVWVSRLPGEAMEGSIVALSTCTDASTIRVYKRGKFLGEGQNVDEYVYFSRVDDRLKISGAAGKQVKSCA